jgi:agmatinase
MNTLDYSLTGSADAGIYGLPGTLDQAALVYIPVPWEVTTSYGKGTALGPAAILQASPQLDLFVRGLPNHYQKGFYLDQADSRIATLNQTLKPLAENIQSTLEVQGAISDNPELLGYQQRVNAGSAELNQLVYERCLELDRQGKALALIGGDHSSPLGLIRFLSEKYQGNFGVLHIDAHFDLRVAYQGFTYSHASIMHNVLALDSAPQALVQVGIRDFCEEECQRAEDDSRIMAFYDDDLKAALYQGETFADLANAIVQALPQNVYVSFDIDGLKPEFCPGTGTPVPGGLDFEQAQYLIRTLVQSGRQIIGFDLCEVAPDIRSPENEWDGNVGARVLFTLSSWMMESRRTR